MSRGEIQHIFQDVDNDGNGNIDFSELDFLAKYFGSNEWGLDFKKKLFSDIDRDNSGTIDSEEFYDWMVLNIQNTGTSSTSSFNFEIREKALALSDIAVPRHLLELLDELGTGGVAQKVTHPLHSAFGRTLRDHFLSCYLLLHSWGQPDAVCSAGIFHALYQRGDGLRAVDFKEMRPQLQQKLGTDVEELIYIFPSAHKSAYEPTGLLHAPLGGDITFKNVLIDGEYLTIDQEMRKKQCELEVVNSHDQNKLCNRNPVHNLWSFYQHATILPLLGTHAQETVVEFCRRSQGASCAQIVEWHENRFRNGGLEVPALWDRHLNMFRPGGKYETFEKGLHAADVDGDGNVDWEEYTQYMIKEFMTPVV